MSKLVAGKAENHQAPGKAALQLVELGEVPGGCASERGHVLNQHCPASECIEIYLLPIQADGSKVVEGLGNVSHGESAGGAWQSGGSPLKGLLKGWGGRRSLKGQEGSHNGALSILRMT